MNMLEQAVGFFKERPWVSAGVIALGVLGTGTVGAAAAGGVKLGTAAYLLCAGATLATFPALGGISMRAAEKSNNQPAAAGGADSEGRQAGSPAAAAKANREAGLSRTVLDTGATNSVSVQRRGESGDDQDNFSRTDVLAMLQEGEREQGADASEEAQNELGRSPVAPSAFRPL